MDANLLKIFIAAGLIAASGGMLGSLALLRRMALVGDALSHVALPGVALGILFHFNPFLGALIFLVFGTFVIWAVEHKTKLPVDTLVGVMFTLALAVGALLTPKEDILDALFGDISNISSLDFWLASITSIVIIILLLMFYKKFTLSLISPDLALAAGQKPHMLELLFLMIFAFAVAVGIKFTGALLMGSLIIIPAATSRNISKSMNQYLTLSALLGVLGAVLGVLVSYFYGFSPGPTFVLFSGAIFFISIFFRR
ncbi:hypothetical protein A3B05_02030 [Candidatus Giovannonibacteria bacterium RIFCSPLOWO2_01_FULL_43_160]|uniref:ABC-3 protein n=2 Tax=Candidatus Giovannoniibacteriota TaxID=1752738 RepID=A0A0G1IW47_9BACT|nr:MAG: ABC-3 protein [Candidatus Giovannonibacteria bacterium GW2011_GWB1_43_13]KKS99895.1 MAG: ABC-3 protein [Candidatus Giovannonibacteria bacterium GW2011_GWA1_43_15]KKT21802.1 MAG: ABC-3 protein [Candidatus Giovannonibacteria bacterium GW2011_GWC2_43_8]KKT63596.1 MAG: ABC-3 protein [Candidatus Giovannonibacteria bacterium GW2011_GWA2_44_26]OGF58530.1 MAG: hypothetical protein A2652_01980 [Candidatus Giovannonibacteria bacterium RIFCSPHIGHO2_01_FULL_43_140]OGF70018.1 MAG: hypothetical prot